MACCILGAIIISQILVVWNARRRIALYLAGLFISIGLFGWQIDQHWHHLQQFAWDIQAIANGEDPAVAALRQSGVVCKTNPTSYGERDLAISFLTPQ